MNPVINMLMQRLQKTNPGGYNMVNQMMQSGGNPQSLIQQMFGNMPSEQKQAILNQAKSYGCPDKILSKLQNIK